MSLMTQFCPKICDSSPSPVTAVVKDMGHFTAFAENPLSSSYGQEGAVATGSAAAVAWCGPVGVWCMGVAGWLASPAAENANLLLWRGSPAVCWAWRWNTD